MGLSPRMKNLTAQLARIELAQQKKEEIVQEKSTKAAEVSLGQDRTRPAEEGDCPREVHQGS